MSSSPSIPPPADAPDPIEGDEFWSPPDEELPATAAGVQIDRVTRHFRQPRTARNGRVRETFEVLVLDAPGAEVLRVPMGRAHAAELVEKEDPQNGDAVSVTVFPRGEGGGYPYALRVNRNGRVVNRDQEALELSGTAKVSRAVNEPLNEEGA